MNYAIAALDLANDTEVDPRFRNQNHPISLRTNTVGAPGHAELLHACNPVEVR